MIDTVKSLCRCILLAADPTIKDRMFVFLLWTFSLFAHHFWNFAQRAPRETNITSEEQYPSEERTFYSFKNLLNGTSTLIVEAPNTDLKSSPSESSSEELQPYTSPPIELVIHDLESGGSPSTDKIMNAYIDLDAEALRIFEGLSYSEKAMLKNKFLTELENLKRTKPRKGESAADFLGRLVRLVHSRSGLKYNTAHNTVTSYTHNNLLQCSSATTLVLMLFEHHAKHFHDAEAVLVFSANPIQHVQPAVIVDKDLFVTEATAQSGRTESIKLEDLEHVVVAKSSEYLTALIAYAAGKQHLFHAQNSVVLDSSFNPIYEQTKDESNTEKLALPLILLGPEGAQPQPKESSFAKDANPTAGLKFALIDTIFTEVLHSYENITLSMSSVRDGSAVLLFKDIFVSDSIGKQRVQLALKNVRADYLWCYKDLQRYPDNEGSIQLRFNFFPNGLDIQILNPEYSSEELKRCILKTSKQLLNSFDKNYEGSFQVTLKYHPKQYF